MVLLSNGPATYLGVFMEANIKAFDLFIKHHWYETSYFPTVHLLQYPFIRAIGTRRLKPYNAEYLQTRR